MYCTNIISLLREFWHYNEHYKRSANDGFKDQNVYRSSYCSISIYETGRENIIYETSPSCST